MVRQTARRGFPTASGFLLAACASAHPNAAGHRGVDRGVGATFAQARGYYGVPILQKSLLWDGNGEDDDAGLGVHVGHFAADDLAIGAGLNLGTWFYPGGNATSGELEGLLRWYPVHDLPLFLDLHGGYQHATEPTPRGGTDWNFSFGFGPGIDLPVGDGCSLELGTTYHHISNALGRQNDRNPSQNEARLWLGVAWTL
ncbi:MAG: outer membrane beta-barrel protein [Planctomycetes bacterium]|nr:outer membrane beta-barrel protein [Planctomycetota bacterium]